MNLSEKGNGISDLKRNTPSKVTTLNPNAAEFVPFSLRSPSSSGGTSVASATARFATSGTIGKPVLQRLGSSLSNISDEEANQFWRSWLPDDITSDFNVINEDDSQGIGSGSLSLAGLSLDDGSEASTFPGSADGGCGYVYGDQQEFLHDCGNGNKLAKKLRCPASSYGEDPTSASLLHLPAKASDKQLVNSDQLLGNGRESHPSNGNLRQGFLNDILYEHIIMDDTEMNPVDFLASEFPGFAAESLAEVYFANDCDLNLTIEMLTQLELQVDGAFNQNPNSNTLPAPNLSSLDFPALAMSDGRNDTPKHAGDDLQHANPYRSSGRDNILMFRSSSSLPSIDAIDFASVVRKMPSQDSRMWKYDANGSADSTVGSSRSSHSSANTYSAATGRGTYTNRVQTRGLARSAPVWLETGDAVANLYSELREEARDHARLRNAYFEQARQAFIIGDKALAKELSMKGQQHNMHMKAAHGKAQESIYRQRNPVPLENIRGQERMIDLHGLHVNEAIHILKYELSVLRSTARAADQRLQVYICVGTGHHTRGSRTPARLPVAVQRYLLEEECLDYTEPQPGLLRVVIY